MTDGKAVALRVQKTNADGLYWQDAERACLGAAILENRLMRGPLNCLAVPDFALSAHRELFSLMLRSDEEGLPFDTLTLVESLRRQGRLDSVGGGAFIDSLTDGVVTHPGLISRHAETVKRHSQLRQLRMIADITARQAGEMGADPEQLLRNLESALSGLRAGYDLDGNLTPIGLPDLARRADLLTLADVEAREVEWIWKPYLAVGMLAMLNGDPGVGKTFLSLAVAAAVTVGRIPDTDEQCEPTDVLYLSVENSPEHVLRPRFDSLGGDPRRFHILRGSVSGDDRRPERGSVRLSDVQLLHDALSRTKARLVIVDPIQSYLGAEVDAHRSNETRPVMDGLTRLAEDQSCCIWLVRHLGKAQTGRAIHRGLGSIDLTGAVRTELLAGCSPDDPTQRALVQVKSNLGQFGQSLGYDIDADGRFRWTGKSHLTATDLLSPESSGEEAGALDEAKDFLTGALAQGNRPAEDIENAARQAGISESTLKRAKKALGVLSKKSGMRGTWEWSLPEGGQL